MGNNLVSPRKIIHVDMDCFYAAVELLERPSLRDKPVAVGGSPDGRGVLTTCNYVAREYGLRSAMSSAVALRKCPDVHFIRPNFQKYRKFSLQIREIFKFYTDKIEPLSLDEAYLDVTGSVHCRGSATLIARAIRKEIFLQTGLTASAGIAPNKFLAKVGSDWKKPNGQFTIKPSDVDSFVKDLHLRKVPGIGPKTFEKLERSGFRSCGDLQRLDKDEMIRRFGKWGNRLFNLCRGIDNRSVESTRKRKSLSVESTFGADVEDLKEFRKKLEKVYQELDRRLVAFQEKEPLVGITTFSVKLKFANFQTASRDKSTSRLFALDEVQEFAEEFFISQGEPIRLLGLRVKFDRPDKENGAQIALDL